MAYGDPMKAGENAALAFRPELTQDEFDREFFGQILLRGDGNSDVLRRQAELLSRFGDYNAALRLDLILADRFSGEPVVHYNLACSLSMTGQLANAVDSLAKAIELGYDDFGHIESDPDLDPLRDLPEFQNLIPQIC